MPSRYWGSQVLDDDGDLLLETKTYIFTFTNEYKIVCYNFITPDFGSASASDLKIKSNIKTINDNDVLSLNIEINIPNTVKP